MISTFALDVKLLFVSVDVVEVLPVTANPVEEMRPISVVPKIIAIGTAPVVASREMICVTPLPAPKNKLLGPVPVFVINV